jgi:hypothetical protein
MDTKSKKLYKGKFNYQGEIHILWRHASNPIEAGHVMFISLSKKLDASPYAIRQYFNGAKDNYKITEVEDDGTR